MKTTDEILQAMYIAAGPITEGESYGEKEIKKVKRRWKKLLATSGLTRVVVKLGNQHWLVSSDSRPGDFHSIEYIGASDYECSCEDSQLNKNKECRHVDTIREVEQHV